MELVIAISIAANIATIAGFIITCVILFKNRYR